jgi:hypothetical protein
MKKNCAAVRLGTAWSIDCGARTERNSILTGVRVAEGLAACVSGPSPLPAQEAGGKAPKRGSGLLNPFQGGEGRWQSKHASQQPSARSPTEKHNKAWPIRRWLGAFQSDARGCDGR